MLIPVLVFMAVSIPLGIIEVGLFVQIFLNFGFAYWVARKRNCKFRSMDSLKIIFATGTVLTVAVIVVLSSAALLGPLIGFINALFSVIYIPYRVNKIFPKGGREKEPSLFEDLKDLVDERSGAIGLGEDE